jgi:glycosyltransferase involved in cell wall biosynthesis
VAIASRNRRDLLVQTLTALDRQTYPSERVEVVVVLDGTTDDSADAIRSLATSYELRVIEQEKRGTGSTKNRGLRETTKPVVVFLDDDIVPDAEFLAAHAQAHASDSDRLLSLGYYPPGTDDRGFWALEVRAWWEDYFRRAAEPNHQWTFVDMAEGNFSTRRELLLETGGWDEEFTGGRRQDWELGARLLKRGAQLSHNAEARGSHLLDTSFATAVRNARQEGRWDVVLARKHPELKLCLPFSQFARAEGGEMSRRGRFAYAHREAASRVNRTLIGQVARLEALGLHRQWRALSWMVLANEYVQGVASELPSLDMLRSFVADADAGVSTVPLVLGRDVATQASAVGPTDVEARCGDATIARTRAPLPAEQWDWESVIDRLVDEAQTPPPPEQLRCVAGLVAPGAAEVLTTWGEQ